MRVRHVQHCEWAFKRYVEVWSINIKQLIPLSFKVHIRLLKQKKKFPNNIIETHKIGNDVLIGISSIINIDADIRDGVSIGNYSYVSPGAIIASGSIGNYCSIGYGSHIGMFEHPVDHVSTSPFIYNKQKNIFGIDTWNEIQDPPIIGNDVWIGSNALILQGVKIGNGAIIAGGAVVTKNVPPYSVVGGVPANVIKYRFDVEKIEYLESIKWWDLPREELSKYRNIFESKADWKAERLSDKLS